MPPIIVDGNGGGSLISPLNGSEMIVKSLPGPNFLRRGASVGGGVGVKSLPGPNSLRLGNVGVGVGNGVGTGVGLRVGGLGLDLEICSPTSKTNDVPE